MSVTTESRVRLPQGNLLSPEEFARRHALLRWVLLPHAVVLFGIGALRGFGVWQTALEASPIVVCWALSRIPADASRRRARLAALAVTAAFSWASIMLVHVTDGQIESHFHFFIILGFIALYQDWLPFAWYVGFTVLSHGLGSALAPTLIFNHHAAQSNPWLWSGIHGFGVAFLAAGLIIFWSHTEAQQRRATGLAVELSEQSLEQTRVDLENRQRQSRLLVNLARRNQSLLQRQLDSIEKLQATEETPENLGELYSLDHMATRMRRNAESLLVLSGIESPRVWKKPVPLADVLQAAAVEIEDYQRISVSVPSSLTVDGRAAADLSHLFSELMENAVTCSPPGKKVQVSALQQVDGDVMVSVRDHGIGFSSEQLDDAKMLLAGVDDAKAGQRLGLTVVGKLAERHGLQVDLGSVPSGGALAQVVIGLALLQSGDPAAEDGQTQGQEARTRKSAPAASRPAPQPKHSSAPAPAAPVEAPVEAPVAVLERPRVPAPAPAPAPAPVAAPVVEAALVVEAAPAPVADDAVPSVAPAEAGTKPALPKRARGTATFVPETTLDLWGED